MPLPNLIVIGAQKCGTTSLHHYLDLHPEIAIACGVDSDEVHFFSWDGRWRRGLEWYARQFREAPVRGEVSTSYSWYPQHPETPARIARTLPGVRLIYLVRDPVERIVSQWHQDRAAAQELRPFEQAVLEDAAYVARSRYATQLERYLAVIPQEQLLVLDQHELRVRRAETLRLVFRFLERGRSSFPGRVCSAGVEARADRARGRVLARPPRPGRERLRALPADRRAPLAAEGAGRAGAPRRAPVPDDTPVVRALAEARRRGDGARHGAPPARRDRPGAPAARPRRPLLPARHARARHARADVPLGVHRGRAPRPRPRQRVRLARLEPHPARGTVARPGVPRVAQAAGPLSRRRLHPGPRARAALPPGGGAHGRRRVGDDLAASPLHGRRADDRRRGRRHAGHARRAAREAHRPQALPRALEGTHRADESRDRGVRLSNAGSGAGEAGTAQQAGGASAAWSGASYERIAAAFETAHRRIVAELAPAPDERFCDLGCGTGGVALIAARAGAEVTGLDISADQLAKARAAAEEAGLEIRFDEGDCEALPYPDASFDVVASAFGLIFADDHARAAAEATRVCRPGGRLAFTSWPEDDWVRLSARLRPGHEHESAPLWADEEHVRSLLPAFDLRFERGDVTFAAASPEELWDLLSTSLPTLKGWLETLDASAFETARREYLDLFRTGSLTREYLLILGVRR